MAEQINKPAESVNQKNQETDLQRMEKKFPDIAKAMEGTGWKMGKLVEEKQNFSSDRKNKNKVTTAKANLTMNLDLKYSNKLPAEIRKYVYVNPLHIAIDPQSGSIAEIWRDKYSDALDELNTRFFGKPISREILQNMEAVVIRQVIERAAMRADKELYYGQLCRGTDYRYNSNSLKNDNIMSGLSKKDQDDAKKMNISAGVAIFFANDGMSIKDVEFYSPNGERIDDDNGMFTNKEITAEVLEDVTYFATKIAKRDFSILKRKWEALENNNDTEMPENVGQVIRGTKWKWKKESSINREHASRNFIGWLVRPVDGKDGCHIYAEVAIDDKQYQLYNVELEDKSVRETTSLIGAIPMDKVRLAEIEKMASKKN